MEPMAIILMTFFCKKPTLHPTAYLLCFRHILETLGSPVWAKFQLKMCVGSRSPQKAVTLSLFLIFRRKCVKMGAQMGGGKSPKNALFLLFYSLVPLWVPLASFSLNFGLPGHHFATFLDEIQHHQGTQNSMKMNPQTNSAGFIDESSNRPDCSAVAGMAVRQLDNSSGVSQPI